MQPRKIRWNRLVILIAGVLGVLLLLCVGVTALAPNLRRIIQAPYWKTDAQLAAQAAHKRFDYDLPPNYQELKVLTMGGEDAAVIITHRDQPEDFVFIEGVLEGTIANHLPWPVRRLRARSRAACARGAPGCGPRLAG